MHFPPFQISPYFRKIFRLCGKSFKFYLSPKISRFPSAKISDDHFLVIDRKFRIPLCFPSSFTFPPVSRKLLFPPYFEKFPPCFRKIRLLFNTLCVFRSPYFDHESMMHLCITRCTYCTPLLRMPMSTNSKSVWLTSAWTGFD